MKYFLTVADCKSFSEAAEQCFISQSAISQQIKVLEAELGVELIQRSNRRFALTPAGEYFYCRCRKIVAEAESLKAQLQQIENKNSRPLRLGCLRGYNIRGLCRAMNAYLEKNPGASLQVVYGGHDELMEMLATKKLDLAINDLRGASESQNFASLHIETADILIAVSNLLPLVGALPPRVFSRRIYKACPASF